MKVFRLSALSSDHLYPPYEYAQYSFLLETESTPRPYCSRKDYVNDTISNRTHDSPPCSAVPRTTVPPRVPQYVKERSEICQAPAMKKRSNKSWIVSENHPCFCVTFARNFSAPALVSLFAHKRAVQQDEGKWKQEMEAASRFKVTREQATCLWGTRERNNNCREECELIKQGFIYRFMEFPVLIMAVP
jgi:hypothetical protein